MRDKIKSFIEGNIFNKSIITIIIINSIILGMETSKYLMDEYGVFLKTADSIILKIFVIEILFRLYIYRLKFFTNPWNIFDFLIVSVSLIPSGEAFSVIRIIRVLRIFRLISVVPTMRKVIEGLLSAIPGIFSVATLMVLFFYIFGVIGTHLYSNTFYDWFGTLGKSMYTLFQIMTLESWSMGIVRPIMEKHSNAWAFFVTYILVTTFTMLNLFIAIIVNAMHKGTDEDAQEDRLEIKEFLIKEIKEMENRLIEKIKDIDKK